MRAPSCWRPGRRTRTIPILPTTSICSRRASAPRKRCADPRCGVALLETTSGPPMLAELKEFFSDLVDGQKPQHQFAEHDYRRAAAALLVHVATLDGELTEVKRDKLHAILEAQYG